MGSVHSKISDRAITRSRGWQQCLACATCPTVGRQLWPTSWCAVQQVLKNIYCAGPLHVVRSDQDRYCALATNPCVSPWPASTNRGHPCGRGKSTVCDA